MRVKPLSEPLVTIFGGSGFVGRHVVMALGPTTCRMRIAVRRPELTGHLQPLGRVGQIHAVSADIRNSRSIAAAVEGSDVVVNLVGILAEHGKQRFETVQFEGAQEVARAAAAVGAKVVHVSAIGADANSRAAYARTKARAEQAVLSQVPDAVILRPSIVFGPNDDFFNRFAAMARVAPFLPAIGGGRTKFQPVYAGDVADAVRLAVEGRARAGAIYELGGPDVISFADLLRFVLKTTGRRRILLPVPFFLAKAMGRVLSLLPNAPITADQVELLKVDNVVSPAAEQDGRTLGGLGLTPRSVAAIVPNYLWRYRRGGQYGKTRFG